MYTVHSTWHAYSPVNVHLPFIGYVDPDGGVSSQGHVIDYRRVCGKQALAKESFNMGVCWVLASSFSKLWLFSLYFRQVLILPIHARIILYKPWNQDPVMNQLGLHGLCHWFQFPSSCCWGQFATDRGWWSDVCWRHVGWSMSFCWIWCLAGAGVAKHVPT